MIHAIRKHLVAITASFLFIVWVVFLSLASVPIQILKDWKISVPEKTYHPGDTVVLESHSFKLRKARGDSERTVECNARTDSIVGYTLNKIEAKRKPGYNQSETNIILPGNIADLPATCRVVISVKYTVFFGLRTIQENNVSNDFMIE